MTNNVNALKAKDVERTNLQKRRRDGGSEGTSVHDGDNTADRNGDLSNVDKIEVNGSDAFNTTRFQLSEEGESFLEATIRVTLRAHFLQGMVYFIVNLTRSVTFGRTLPSALKK